MSSFSIGALPSAVQSAQLGISRGMSGLDRDAQVVANGNLSSGGGSVTDALVDSLQQRNAVEASARMLSTADQTLGTLIDVTA
jgi:hypothetical protein